MVGLLSYEESDVSSCYVSVRMFFHKHDKNKVSLQYVHDSDVSVQRDRRTLYHTPHNNVGTAWIIRKTGYLCNCPCDLTGLLAYLEEKEKMF